MDRKLRILLTDLVSQINDCSFCEDLDRAIALREHLGLKEKFEALKAYRTSTIFSTLSENSDIWRNHGCSSEVLFSRGQKSAHSS